MDARLDLSAIETNHAELRRRADAARARRWPDDGLPARRSPARRRRSLHPVAVVASLLTWR